MDLYVVTWHRRKPLDATGDRWATGWTRGIAAFTEREPAVAELERQVLEARANAGEGRKARRAVELGASSGDLVAYTLTGPPSLELLAQVITNPPRGDELHHGDPLAQAGTWWSSARVIRSWWGGSDLSPSTPCTV